jgi:hypothetical protein
VNRTTTVNTILTVTRDRLFIVKTILKVMI